MSAPASLRLRLTGIILGPLLSIALAVGYWQVQDARDKAATIFDRSLLTVAMAISADVARSGGDALSLETRDLLTDTSGGQVYYHVYAPNGYYITGYATPPVRHAGEVQSDAPYQYYNSTYHRQEVRALRLRSVTTVGGVTGTYTVTVWQEVEMRDALMRDLAQRAFIIMAVLIGTVALVVWFGVRIGLRPLTDLEDAISQRSSDDLSPIRRPVPPEARGLVRRLNSLLGQLEASMARQANFVSNAAHQLRNPIAGVLAMAEAVRSAPTPEAARSRAEDLIQSARHAKDLANKLLALERASGAGGARARVDLGALLEDCLRGAMPAARTAGVRLTLDQPEEELVLHADPVMLREAVVNLIDNALRHGGPGLRQIRLSLSEAPGPRGAALASIIVADDGAGLPAELHEIALSRFGQATPGEGSGLGLSIARAVARGLKGELTLSPAPEGGLQVTLRLPVQAPPHAGAPPAGPLAERATPDGAQRRVHPKQNATTARS